MKKSEKARKPGKKAKIRQAGKPGDRQDKAPGKRKTDAPAPGIETPDRQLLTMIGEVKKLARDRKLKDVELLLQMSEVMRAGLVPGPATGSGKQRRGKKKKK